MQAQLEAQAQAWIGHHGFSGVGQQGQIGSVVADVVERAGELAAQAVELAVSGQVDCAVAAEHAGEDAEMIGDALGQTHIRAGGEIDGAAAGTLLVEKLQQLAVVGQMRHVEGDLRGDERLERRLAAKEASRQARDRRRRMGARQHQQRVDESIGLDESSVEIDAQGPEHCCGSFRRRDDLGQPFTSCWVGGRCNCISDACRSVGSGDSRRERSHGWTQWERQSSFGGRGSAALVRLLARSNRRGAIPQILPEVNGTNDGAKLRWERVPQAVETLVELSGIEPLASSLRTRRSPS